MAATDINPLDIDTLDGDGVAALIAAGETVVERKEKRPNDGFGPSVAADANSGGGWLLIGVTDGGDVVGWQQPGRGQLHDWMRNELRESIDPLPLYACRAVDYEGNSVVVIRVYPGNPPYLLRKSGSVYVREPGGKSPIGTQQRLLDFVRQNGETEASATARLEPSQKLGLLLHADSDPPAVPNPTHRVDWVLIGTPQVLPVDLAARALRESSVQAATARLAAVLDANTIRPRSDPPRVAGAALAIDGRSDKSGIFMRVVVTAAGTVAAKLTEHTCGATFHVGSIEDIRIASLLTLVFGTLTDLGATGRGLLHLSMRGGPVAAGASHVVTLGSANQGYPLSIAQPLEITDEMLLPTTPESIKATAERLMRAVAREAGIAYMEPEPTPG